MRLPPKGINNVSRCWLQPSSRGRWGSHRIALSAPFPPEIGDVEAVGGGVRRGHESMDGNSSRATIPRQCTTPPP